MFISIFILKKYWRPKEKQSFHLESYKCQGRKKVENISCSTGKKEIFFKKIYLQMIIYLENPNETSENYWNQ
jgi:hypothetical protein